MHFDYMRLKAYRLIEAEISESLLAYMEVITDDDFDVYHNDEVDASISANMLEEEIGCALRLSSYSSFSLSDFVLAC